MFTLYTYFLSRREVVISEAVKRRLDSLYGKLLTLGQNGLERCEIAASTGLVFFSDSQCMSTATVAAADDDDDDDDTKMMMTVVMAMYKAQDALNANTTNAR